jgi:TatA/E family protein of Tat protein translocase
MQSLAANPLMFALHSDEGWEAILILAMILISFGARKLPEFTRGLGEGFSEFRRSVGFVSKELDQAVHDAGESLGGIYGKPAAQALTPDNQTAELYDPANIYKPGQTGRGTKSIWFRSWGRWWRPLWYFVSQRLNPKL